MLGVRGREVGTFSMVTICRNRLKSESIHARLDEELGLEVNMRSLTANGISDEALRDSTTQSLLNACISCRPFDNPTGQTTNTAVDEQISRPLK